ncbi:MAG TPA: hypothetical protein VHO46_07225, partial [Bacteroidales bacterium]|nr:hypothetical protein [Bacteroidales bacterium]
MKIRIALSISLLLFIILTTSGQSVQSVRFSYDANGNRKSRKIIVEELPVETIPPNPVPLSLNQSPEAKKGKQQLADIDINPDEQTILKVSDDECRVLIYPNPTKGILKIVVNNMPINRVSEFRLYDM